MKREGLLAWIVVATTLVVPSFSLKAWLSDTVDKARRQEQSRRHLREIPVFSGTGNRNRLINPAASKPVIRIHEDLPESKRIALPSKATPVLRLALPGATSILAHLPLPSARSEKQRVKPHSMSAVRRKAIEDSVNVEAIIALEGRSSAIVNGLAVQVGDMVGKLKVILITTERVTFAYKNLRFAKSI